MTPTNQQLLDSYSLTRSVWKTGQSVGLSGQSVHVRLRKLGAVNPMRALSKGDKQRIMEVYQTGFLSGDGALPRLATTLGRTIPFICRAAGEMGLTNLRRKSGTLARLAVGSRIRALWKSRPHPKGMLGKKHSVETLALISRKGTGRKRRPETISKWMRTRLERYGKLCSPRVGTSWKSGWRDVGGRRVFFRSKWEANYARFLELLKRNGDIKEWEHEPETFWFDKIKRGCRSYLPDFRVTELNGTVAYHEVKGWMDARSKTKIRRMRIYYPQFKLIVIAAPWFKANNRKLAGLIKGWE